MKVGGMQGVALEGRHLHRRLRPAARRLLRAGLTAAFKHRHQAIDLVRHVFRKACRGDDGKPLENVLQAFAGDLRIGFDI